jgi:hypothetical protein
MMNVCGESFGRWRGISSLCFADCLDVLGEPTKKGPVKAPCQKFLRTCSPSLTASTIDTISGVSAVITPVIAGITTVVAALSIAVITVNVPVVTELDVVATVTTPAFERLAHVVINGATISVVSANDAFGINGATTAGVVADVGIPASDANVEAGFGSVWSSEETNQNGGGSGE